MVRTGQFFNLTVEHLLYLLRPLFLRCFLFQFSAGTVHRRIAQFLLNSLNLLIQNIFLLLTVNLLLRFILNISLDFQNLDFLIHIF